MTPQLPEEILNAVTADPTGALKIQTPDGTTVWVLTDEALRVRQLVQEGIAEADRGECSPWSADEMKQDGRERLAQLKKNDQRSS